jgi:hypothetical protein
LESARRTVDERTPTILLGMVTIQYQREQNHQTIFDLVGWR